MWPAAAIEVFSSSDSYAGVLGGYHLTLGATPNRRVEISLGPPDRRWFVARRRMLRLLVGRGQGIPSWLAGTEAGPVVRMLPRKRWRPWYTTLRISLGDLSLEDAAQQDVQEATGILEHAACLTAAMFSANLIEKLEFRGVFLQRPYDSAWVKIPEPIVLGGQVGVGRLGGVIETELANAAGSMASTQLGTDVPLSVRWAARALLAKDDPTDEFSYWMWSLEQLAGDVYDAIRANPHIVAGLRADADRFLVNAGSKRSPTTLERRQDTAAVAMVAFTAAHLTPSTGSRDVKAFRVLRKVRDGLLHGTTMKAPTGEQRAKIRELGLRYCLLASKAAPI